MPAFTYVNLGYVLRVGYGRNIRGNIWKNVMPIQSRKQVLLIGLTLTFVAVSVGPGPDANSDNSGLVLYPNIS